MTFKCCTESTCVCVVEGRGVNSRLRKILWFTWVCVCHSELVRLCVSLRAPAHTNTYMHMHTCFECIWLSACFPYGFYWSISLLYPLCSFSVSVSLSVCTDGEGMMECWRVNLWFPGSWSDFIRSGCDNTRTDGPTQCLSYKHQSANEKLSWKK